MAHRIRYIMIGGFLGAGKTTTLGKLAAHYREQGLNVGIVTNDQASDLVDTNTLRGMGFDVGEVAGACFCCNFNELIDTMGNLSAEQRPDVILAEPVGSCTDLVATVIQPIKQLFDAEFDIAPYPVILKPSHGIRILKNEQRRGFSPKAEYILKKQLEEADLILINRIDELTNEEIEEISALCDQQLPGTPLIRMSAKTGSGIPELVEFLSQDGDFGKKILDIDYDIYADGEAELGWLNSSLTLTSENEFDLDSFLFGVVETLQTKLEEANLEPAHLKAIGLWEGFFGVANLISSDTKVELSLPSNQKARTSEVIINARVACDPELLETLVNEAVADVAAKQDVNFEFRQTQRFRPGRPVPTHRVSTPVGS
ncbi:signal recognition particle protein Srp54 [Thalassoglobus neptunius]|uniref:Signal recognition particle protein Srp54 n=1 Tax=Thalassoglobus neptunius TaxID=1938619 RepID=A0A5C5X709_9PLAN|nr:GTP-binding protein [Thalassoglobus neptunius]TWT58684.1 signal recognition particle protein Srp54 [Thalassoglobus neptunius]